ncbi:MAG TPA: hypothetical protein VGU45_00235 [Microvirga sp.]|jgi:hypothetical protein|nr:hypothetical protein [Microvirga sp.]
MTDDRKPPRPDHGGPHTAQVGDQGPGNRPADAGPSPLVPGGSEQPKNDRRRRGDLQKRQ